MSCLANVTASSGVLTVAGYERSYFTEAVAPKPSAIADATSCSRRSTSAWTSVLNVAFADPADGAQFLAQLLVLALAGGRG